MKNKLVIISLCVAFSNCSSSSKIGTRTVIQQYFNLQIKPDGITKPISSNLDLTVLPLDATNLDRETYEAAFRDGNYSKEFIQIIETWKDKLATASKQDRALLQGKINAFDYLSKLEKDNQIPILASYNLRRIIVNQSEGKDGTEIESLSDKEIATSEYNPFKINQNYFSVIKVTFRNKGKALEKVSIKDFQLSSNEEQLYPLTTDYFEKNLQTRTESIKNAFRMNMPIDLVITPNQTVTKYLAVPAVNTDNNLLQIQYIKNDKVENFEFNIKKYSVNKSYNLERYDIAFDGSANQQLKLYYAILYKNGRGIPLKDNHVFITDDQKNIPVVVYGLAIGLSNGEIMFSKETQFTFASTKNHKHKALFKSIKKEKRS